jgi:hypothetical protein
MAKSPAETSPRIAALARARQQLSMTVLSSRQRGRFTTNPQMSDSNENLVLGARCLSDTKTHWPTNRRS